MPDIFGRNPGDYQLHEALREEGNFDTYQRSLASRMPGVHPTHNFEALSVGIDGTPAHMRATEDAIAAGFLTNNTLAIQSMVDEILYTSYRLPNFVTINTSIPEGASAYGVRTTDRVGRAQRISGPGYEAPSATVSQSLVTQRIDWYGLDAEYSIDELRGAQFAGLPLDTQAVDAAVTGTLEQMEAVALTGDGLEEKGLLNQNTTGTNAVAYTDNSGDATKAWTHSNATAKGIRNQINGEMSKVIEVSKETLGRNITTGMTVYLPGTQYDLLTTLYIGDNADKTLMRSMVEDNPWTSFTGNPISFQRVLELDGIGNNNSDRMVVCLKHRRVAEIGVSISPRVLAIINKGRVVCAQIEAKLSPLFVKRAETIHYTDGI